MNNRVSPVRKPSNRLIVKLQYPPPKLAHSPEVQKRVQRDVQRRHNYLTHGPRVEEHEIVGEDRTRVVKREERYSF